MAKIVAYMPTYAPDVGVEDGCGRPMTRLVPQQIANRVNELGSRSRARPYMYMDCIDSIVGMRPDIQLIVGDARSSDVVREGLLEHNKNASGYQLSFYPEKMSQWKVMNDIITKFAGEDTHYFVYTSSDVIWPMDWVAEAEKEFDKDPTLQILFPTVSSGDSAIPVQIANGPVDVDLVDPADHIGCLGMSAARAPCLNAYAIIFRMDFFRQYGGYMNLFLNCFTESFLYYQCEAMGGKMRLMPRGWVFHHNGGDVWVGEGGHYNYIAEKPIFDTLMPKVLEARSRGEMTVDYLKEVLYRNGNTEC